MGPERKEKLVPLQERLGYRFRDLNYLNKALTHKSYVNESPDSLKNNERFEFLGDSVLDLIVSHYMVRNFPDFAEGALSKIRAAVVNENCLAQLSRQIDLGSYLLLGKGEELSGGRSKPSLLANTYEAVVGAVYFDSELETTRNTFLSQLEPEIKKYAETWEFRDFKSELQEFTQVKLSCIPSYKVVKETGPDHAKQFEVVVLTQNEVRGRGRGKSKKEAEQNAAQNALERLG